MGPTAATARQSTTREARRRGKPRGIRRDRDCHSCKFRGIKCDLNRPQCLPCVQSGLVCGGYPRRVVWVGEKTVRKDIKETSPDSTTACSVSPVESAPSPSKPTLSLPVAVPAFEAARTDDPPRTGASMVTQYSFVKCLTAFYEQINRYAKSESTGRGTYLSDEAIQLVSRVWDFARSRIRSYSSSPMDLAHPSSTESIRSQVAALMVLNQAIGSEHPVALFGIATFAFFEVCDGSFGEWECHLRGARSLLDLHCRSRSDLDRLNQQIPGVREIVTPLVWFDTMRAIIRARSGLIFDDWHRAMLNESFFNMVGCRPDTFGLFVLLAKLDCGVGASEITFLVMDQLLRLDSADATDRGRTASVYRCAAVIAALGRMGNDAPIARWIALSSAVDRACDLIASMSPRSGFYIHLAVPAYLAGINATTPRQCEVIRTYWQNCRAYDFPHYPDGEARCEENRRRRMSRLGITS